MSVGATGISIFNIHMNDLVNYIDFIYVPEIVKLERDNLK